MFFGRLSSSLSSSFTSFTLKPAWIVRCYGNARINRSENGLYAGRGMSFGNTISAFRNKNPRTWKPNVQRASLFSAALDCKVRLRVTTEALRQMDRVGGLDNYILGQVLPESKAAAKLKDKIMTKLLEREVKSNDPVIFLK